MTSRILPLIGLLALAACSREGRIGQGGIFVERSACPQLAIPAGTGDITLFDPADSTAATAIDVSAAITNLRANCYEDAENVTSVATFDVLAQRRDAGPARQVVLPVFNVSMQGGETVASKKVGRIVLNFEAGSIRTASNGQATIRVNRGAATIPEEARRELTRRRRPGDVDAAVDPLTIPSVREAVKNATFEHLVGFQLTPEQLRYNVTR